MELPSCAEANVSLLVNDSVVSDFPNVNFHLPAMSTGGGHDELPLRHDERSTSMLGQHTKSFIDLSDCGLIILKGSLVSARPCLTHPPPASSGRCRRSH